MKFALKLTPVALLALVITGCSSQSNAQRAETGSINAARSVVSTFFGAEQNAFKAGSAQGFDFIAAHGFPGFRTFQQETSCRDKWVASGQIIYFKPDLGTLRVDKQFGIPQKVGSQWKYSKTKPPGITYAVYTGLSTKDNTHPTTFQGSTDLHFTVWNGNVYGWNIICG